MLAKTKMAQVTMHTGCEKKIADLSQAYMSSKESGSSTGLNASLCRPNNLPERLAGDCKCRGGHIHTICDCV